MGSGLWARALKRYGLGGGGQIRVGWSIGVSEWSEFLKWSDISEVSEWSKRCERYSSSCVFFDDQ
jgi:hypothetical protein